MKVRSLMQSFALAALMTVAVVPAYGADEYSFNVHNNTDQKITKILVSEDGDDYGYFDIGSGINAGKTVELVWDASTNGESCEQFFVAVFASGAKSDPVSFDFCESGLTLEFE